MNASRIFSVPTVQIRCMAMGKRKYRMLMAVQEEGRGRQGEKQETTKRLRTAYSEWREAGCAVCSRLG